MLDPVALVLVFVGVAFAFLYPKVSKIAICGLAKSVEALLKEAGAWCRHKRDTVRSEARELVHEGHQQAGVPPTLRLEGERTFGAIFYSLIGCTETAAESALLFFTLAPMVGVELETATWILALIMGVGGVVAIIFWGSVVIDLLGWTHLASWPSKGNAQIAFCAFAVLNLICSGGVMMLAALYREQLLVAGDTSEGMVRAILILLTLVAFTTAYVASSAFSRVWNEVFRVYGRYFAASLLGCIAVAIRITAEATDLLQVVAEAWFNEHVDRQEQARRRKAALFEAKLATKYNTSHLRAETSSTNHRDLEFREDAFPTDGKQPAGSSVGLLVLSIGISLAAGVFLL